MDIPYKHQKHHIIVINQVTWMTGLKINKMKNNKVLSLLLGLTFLLSLSLVCAATGTVSFDLPATGSTVSGTVVLNVTNSSTGFDEMNNCTFTLASSLTANTSVTIGSFDNDTLFNVNTTFDTTTVEDATDYVFTASCKNSSNDDASSTTSVTIDNTIPQTPSALSPATGTIDADGSITFSGTVTGVNTTICTLNFDGVNYGGDDQSMTHTGNTCSLTLSNVPDQTYKWYITASDGTNTTDSSTLTVTSDVKTSSGKAALLAQQAGVTSQGGHVLSIASLQGNAGWIAIIVIIVIVGFVIMRRK